MRRFVLLLSVALSFVLALGCGNVCAQSFEDELRHLLQTHPQVLEASKNVQASEEGIGIAFSGYLPDVKLNADTGFEHIDSRSRRVTEGEPWNKGRETAGVTITQKIFDGFATPAKVQGVRLEKEKSEVTLEGVRQDILFSGVKALGVLKGNRLVMLARNSEKSIATRRDLEEERVNKGSGNVVEVMQSRQKLTMAKERRVTYEGGLEDALTVYQQLFDHPPTVAALRDPAIPENLIPKTLEEVIDIGLKENPTIDVRDREIRISQAKKRGAEAGYYPSLDLEGKANYKDDDDGTLGIRRDYSVKLKAKVDLFSGFATKSAVAQASFEQAAGLDKKMTAERKVISDAKQAWQALDTAKKRLVLLESAVPDAREVLDSQKKRRDAGAKEVQAIDVLDAEADVYNAEINHASAFYDARQAAFQLLSVMGRLDFQTLFGDASENSPPNNRQSIKGNIKQQ
jgi:adhesin transport system outer membrane protein